MMNMNYKALTYNQSLSLLTDFYEISMAYGYWKSKSDRKEAVFHLFFRKNPFKGGFAVACGLEYAIDYLENFGFDKTDLDYLSSFRGNDNKLIFEKAFLDYLGNLKFECNVDAMPEGTIVFPHEPLIRIQGPIIQAQILETALLNILNFQTLIATKAARMLIASQGTPILEFGLRRAQGIDGALAASRAAYIGGCAATSNVLAGKLFGIPVRGTQAHSWVMTFDNEAEAFKAYAKAMPNNCIFLVDTFDTLAGVKRAAEIGKWLRQQGHEMTGIRLDSGDLAHLSIEARRILDAEGFPEAIIVASNELDEGTIAGLKKQGAKIAVWGVGTKLITAYDQPALGGVYKLSAIREPNREWKYKLKLSEEEEKVSNPGILQVRRYSKGNKAIADVIYDKKTDLSNGCIMVDSSNIKRRQSLSAKHDFKDLLVPVFRKGKRIYPNITIEEVKENARHNLDCFQAGIKLLVNPSRFPVGIEKSLHVLKTDLIRKTREK